MNFPYHSGDRNNRRKPARRGFTLVESLVALTLMVMAGALILLSVESTVSTSDAAVEQTIATGVANQIIDEVLGKRYMAAGAGPYQSPLGASSWELDGAGRERFDDTDDFHGFVADGAEDIWGQPLGEGDDAGGLRHAALRAPKQFFSNWRQEIEVYYVDDNDLSARLPNGSTSNFRAVEVTILRRLADGALRELAVVRRVYAYIPPPPAG